MDLIWKCDKPANFLHVQSVFSHSDLNAALLLPFPKVVVLEKGEMWRRGYDPCGWR